LVLDWADYITAPNELTLSKAFSWYRSRIRLWAWIGLWGNTALSTVSNDLSCSLNIIPVSVKLRLGHDSISDIVSLLSLSLTAHEVNVLLVKPGIELRADKGSFAPFKVIDSLVLFLGHFDLKINLISTLKGSVVLASTNFVSRDSKTIRSFNLFWEPIRSLIDNEVSSLRCIVESLNLRLVSEP